VKKKKMNGKKALPLLVIASMMLSLLPSIMFANAAFTFTNFYLVTNGVEGAAVAAGVKGNVIAAKGTGATAGTLMSVYWDDSTINPFNGVKGFLNSTTVGADGSFDLWFTLPEAKNGLHYLWFKDSSGTAYGPYPGAGFTVNAKVKLSSSSGQPTDTITVNYYGYSATKDLKVAFLTAAQHALAWPAAWPVVAPAWNETLVASTDGVTLEWTGTLAHTPIQPGSITVMSNYVAATTVTVNYVTGAYDVVFAVAPAAGKKVTILYSQFDTAAINFLDTSVTNSVGSATTTETIPSVVAGDYYVAAFDSKAVETDAKFTIGPVITLTPTSSTVGAIVHILGRGYTAASTITKPGIVLTESGTTLAATCMIYNPSSGTVTADATGRFTMDIVIPQGVNVKDDYTLTVTASDAKFATASFQITAKASVSVNPQFGAQGTSFTVAGTNFAKLSGTGLSVDLTDSGGAVLVHIGSATTLPDGTFSKALTVPAYAGGSYKVKVSNSTMNIQASASFTIGNMVILLSKSSAPVGANNIVLTGSGFTPSGAYNITLGSKTILSSGAASLAGVISYTMTIPSMAPGAYTVKVYDKATGIPVTAQFTVTYNTQLTLAPSSFPTGFNVSVTGQGFRYSSGSISFIVYNKTASGTTYSIWTMDVKHGTPGTTAVVNGTGFALGWWNFNAGTIKLSNGVYYVNATDANGYKATTTFTVINKVVSCEPRKTTFLIGDVISFNMQHSFGNVAPILNSKLTIYDPSGTIVFRGDQLATWVKSGDYYVVPYSAQTAGGNPMQIADDAPLGTWSWKWVNTDGDTVASGTFAVAGAPLSTLAEQVANLTTDVNNLKESVAGVATNVNSLATSVQAIGTAVQAASQTASSAATAAQAASTAAQAASTQAQAATTAAQAATTAANAAKDAANAAAAAANSLTTLVYGAIGASIVAALAAIVALMQISRKIA
jgi:uncharacterized protein YoxC